MDGIRYAKDYQCSDCDAKAEVFFPVFDPDIPAYPYCRVHAEKRRIELLIELANSTNNKT